jgi:hypothetical protein
MSDEQTIPSKTRSLQALASRLGNELRIVNDSIYDMKQNMDEQGFDGDFDPCEKLKSERARLSGEIDAVYAALNVLPDERTPDEIQEDEDAAEDAQQESWDRHTRWEENGRPVDPEYYGYGNDD